MAYNVIHVQPQSISTDSDNFNVYSNIDYSQFNNNLIRIPILTTKAEDLVYIPEYDTIPVENTSQNSSSFWSDDVKVSNNKPLLLKPNTTHIEQPVNTKVVTQTINVDPNLDPNIGSLTFKQMVDKYGQGMIKVSNWKRRDPNANFGVKNSHHKEYHPTWKYEDGTSHPNAFDITPTKGYSFDDLRKLMSSEVWRTWFLYNKWGVLDEANGKKRSWKKTGDHLHLGPDKQALKEYEDMYVRFKN